MSGSSGFTRGVAMLVVLLLSSDGYAAPPAARAADAALDRALSELVAMPGGPPGVIAIVQRGGRRKVFAHGVRELGQPEPPRANDFMRIASVAKAFSGAVALALVDDGTLSLDDTIGRWLPAQPAAWHSVTLRQLLGHTSGVPDFTENLAFRDAFLASPTVALPPAAMLAFVADVPLNFPPGTQYLYSNSDNIVVGLMVEAATGRPYEEVLQAEVAQPLGLARTSLPSGPELPVPFIHGYDVALNGSYEDMSEFSAAGWAWASGGIVSSPADLNRFIRGYVRGRLFRPAIRREQRSWIPTAHSEPPGPGENSAGLALFRYETECGTMFGHTGNTFGFTQFAAATADGRRSVTVAMTVQRTQKSLGWELAVFEALHAAEERAACAALARN
jgi:D-alanyl-D-alanine carboxypeptidase